MSGTREPVGRLTPVGVAELFQNYLQKQAMAQEEGVGFADITGEVQPYEATPIQPIDPQLAWIDTQSLLRYFPKLPTLKFKAPPDWPQLVAAQEPTIALTFSLGNFPQMVRNLQPLLAGGDLTAMRTIPGRSMTTPELRKWAEALTEVPERLLAVGVLRLAGDLDLAKRILQSILPGSEWEVVCQNEAGALAWQRGQFQEAARIWAMLPESVPTLFNRGMAALFQSQPAEAQHLLSRAVVDLPETSAWHHLGQLYLTLAR